jgi:hypothetical protein
MTNTHTFTHRDLAQLLGVSETTVKSYRTKFPSFLPVARLGKPVRLHPEALEVCRAIRRLFAEGLSIEQTAIELRTEFKEYPHNRRLSIAYRQPQPDAADSPREVPPAKQRDTPAASEQVAQLTELVRQLHESQQRAQEQAQERIAMLEHEVRNLATMEAASKAMVADLVGELRASRAQVQDELQARAEALAESQILSEAIAHVEDLSEEVLPSAVAQPIDSPTETVLTARKIVTVHGNAGPAVSYTLNREPKPEPLFRPALPPREFLDLPAVILSDRGDFLGLPGGQSITRLVEALSASAGDEPVTWLEEGPDAWVCLLPLGRALTRELSFERTKTPRGNLVGLIRRMRQGETEADAAELQELFRQVRDQMA